MNIIISLLLVFLLVLFFSKSIKKYPVVFYVLSIIFTIFICYCYKMKIYEVVPEWVVSYILDPFKRGAFATMIFIIVMYTGLLNPKWSIGKKLYSIRGELAIIGCIMTILHNVIYGFIGKKQHLIKLFLSPSEMETKYFLAAIVTVISLILMLPLMITSFKSVKRKMSYKNWKKVQMLAYPFFALIYVHIMILFIPKIDKKMFEIIIYSTIFIGYFILRIIKYYKVDKKIKVNIKN